MVLHRCLNEVRIPTLAISQDFDFVTKLSQATDISAYFVSILKMLERNMAKAVDFGLWALQKKSQSLVL